MASIGFKQWFIRWASTDRMARILPYSRFKVGTMFSKNVFASLIILLILTGCASQPVPQPAIQGLERQELSDTAINNHLDAAQTLLENQEYPQGLILLKNLPFEKLNVSQQTRYALLIAKLHLGNNEPKKALEWLAGEQVNLFDGLPQKQQIEISLLRAQGWEQSGQYLAAARERIYVAPVLSADQHQQNHEQIWLDLQEIPLSQLQQLSRRESSPDFQGWLMLAAISIDTESDLDSHLAAINTWRQQNPLHPAAKQLPGGLDLLTQLAQERPRHIGLMLPLKGNLARSGEAIRDGFMTSYYQALKQGSTLPRITLVDTSETQNIMNQYNKLVAEGVQLIIGPLSKQHVRTLQQQEKLAVPVLAMNYGDATLEQPAELYQFGLSPEDEARQVANKAFQQGYRQVAMLLPEGSWGGRISNAFREHWKQLGGEIVSEERFNSADNRNYLKTVRSLFNIDDSVNRTALLEQVIGHDVEYEPRRRQDVDLIFLASLPTHARQLLPMFDFQYAGDLPVYAISTVYSGKDDRNADKDIEGVRFIDMPWQLYSSRPKQEVHDVFGSKQVNGYDRLYALGVDVYQLYPRLRQLDNIEGSRLHGYTGTLFVDPFNQVRRELTWAEIRNGLARPIEFEQDQEL